MSIFSVTIVGRL